MKIAVSYISSDYDLKETIKRINESTADYIHMDIMDGKMVPNKELNIKKVLKFAKKDLDIHLMVRKPIKYLKYFKGNPLVKNIYFHPDYQKGVLNFIDELRKNNISPGIVIDKDDDIEKFAHFYKHVDRVLLMAVKAGYGGQSMLGNALYKTKELIKYRDDNKETFKILLDGGITDKTLKEFKGLDIDTIISGSFICKSNNFDNQIDKLKRTN